MKLFATTDEPLAFTRNCRGWRRRTARQPQADLLEWSTVAEQPLEEGGVIELLAIDNASVHGVVAASYDSHVNRESVFGAEVSLDLEPGLGLYQAFELDSYVEDRMPDNIAASNTAAEPSAVFPVLNEPLSTPVAEIPGSDDSCLESATFVPAIVVLSALLVQRRRFTEKQDASTLVARNSFRSSAMRTE